MRLPSLFRLPLQVTGPGVSGGAAGSPMSFFVTCKDSGGKRVPIGGAHVEVHRLWCHTPSRHTCLFICLYASVMATVRRHQQVAVCSFGLTIIGASHLTYAGSDCATAWCAK